MATYNGDDGNNTITGSDDDDTMTGGGGVDMLEGGDGNDDIFGGDDQDYLSGEDGNDTLDGGSGNDNVGGGDGNDTIYGGDGFDHLVGDAIMYSPGSNPSAAMSAPTTLTLVNSADGPVHLLLIGSDGSLTLTQTIPANTTVTQDTFVGQNWVLGDSAGYYVQLIEGAADQVVTYGENTDDLMYGGAGGDFMRGQYGDDTLFGGTGDDTMYGETGDDTLAGGAGNDTLYGGDGDDTFVMSTTDDDDQVFGGDGNDTLEFGAESGVGVDYTSPGAGTYTQNSDATTGTFTSVESITTGWGDDSVDASDDAGGVTVSTGAGADTITGGSGDDSIDAGSGDDTLFGGQGNDTLAGGWNNDTLFGGDGDDTLSGGWGDDTLTGGDGDDTFVMDPLSGSDVITDFDLTDSDSDGFYNDQIDVSDLLNGNGDPVTASDVTTIDDGSGNAVLLFPGGETLVLQGVSPSQMNTAPQMYAAGIPCFTAQTMIRTPNGDVPVEDLSVGDLVCTVDNGPQPIVWVGCRTLGQAALRRRPDLAPVHIEAGALGNDAPLRVSPQHGVLLRTSEGGGSERLVRAKHLAEMQGGKVRIARGVASVTYVHLMFETHQAVFSNGIASESFYPGPMGLAALDVAGAAEIHALFPKLLQTKAVHCYGPTARMFYKRRHLVDRLDHAGGLLCV